MGRKVKTVEVRIIEVSALDEDGKKLLYGEVMAAAENRVGEGWSARVSTTVQRGDTWYVEVVQRNTTRLG